MYLVQFCPSFHHHLQWLITIQRDCEVRSREGGKREEEEKDKVKEKERGRGRVEEEEKNEEEEEKQEEEEEGGGRKKRGWGRGGVERKEIARKRREE